MILAGWVAVAHHHRGDEGTDLENGITTGIGVGDVRGRGDEGTRRERERKHRSRAMSCIASPKDTQANLFECIDPWNETEPSPGTETEIGNVTGTDTGDRTADPDPGSVTDLSIEQSQKFRRTNDPLSQVLSTGMFMRERYQKYITRLSRIQKYMVHLWKYARVFSSNLFFSLQRRIFKAKHRRR